MNELSQQQKSRSRAHPASRSLIARVARGAAFCLAALAGVGATTVVYAGHDAPVVDTYVDYARVVDVSPIVDERYVTRSREVCHRPVYDRHVRNDWRAERRHPRAHQHAGSTIVGGLIGGAIGNQFGGGNGKRALTVAGALLGASIANEAARNHHGDYYEDRAWRGHQRTGQQVCERVRERVPVSEIVGYDVTYSYQGRTFHKRMDEHPGRRIPIEVSVSSDRDVRGGVAGYASR